MRGRCSRHSASRALQMVRYEGNIVAARNKKCVWCVNEEGEEICT